MFKFQHGKSYLWAFPVYLILFVGGFALASALGRFNWGILTLPAFMAVMLSCELRSGVALDSWWRASHLKGSWQYQALLVWQTIGFVCFLVMSYVFIFVE